MNKKTLRKYLALMDRHAQEVVLPCLKRDDGAYDVPGHSVQDNCLLGIYGEVGELIDMVKKHKYHGKLCHW
jgi:hypothetical protein